MKLDILVFAAHPDDAELSCSGTIVKHIKKGYKVGIVDLTQGELGSRGTVETRKAEAENSKKILGLSVRENLKLKDGFFEINEPTKLLVAKAIRKYQPEIILANAPEDRHPDHGRASKLIYESCFISGLQKIELLDETGTSLEKWRPKNLFYYIQDRYLKPDFAVDITEEWSKKLQSIKAFETQFFNPSMDGPVTPISTEGFWHFLEARARDFGRDINAEFAEGFINSKLTGVSDLFTLN